MADYTELIRCLRDCCGFPTETDYTCDSDNCLMKDKIVEHTDEDGEPYFTDYTECESALGLAAADAIEELANARNELSAMCLKLTRTIDEMEKENMRHERRDGF